MGATMKTIEEWISKVRAEYNLRECNENELSFEDDLQRATKIIEHLLGACEFYNDQWRYTGNAPQPLGVHANVTGGWDRGEIAQQALAAAEKEIGG